MNRLQQGIKKYYKEYIIKMNNSSLPIIRLESGKQFIETFIGKLNVKWLRLPSEADCATLQKLCIHNESSSTVDFQILIQYKVLDNISIPFVYYSPTNEAMMICHNNEYSLIGGVSSQRGPSQYQTNEKDVELSERVESIQTVYPPISQDSKGFGMGYQLKVAANSHAHVYDWEINHHHLYELEKSHKHFKDLLAEKMFH
ncbi:hypothetical protein ACM26V_24490 [Salipaludibacillus sp. HK11]|uniref:hypothetical protein n=1 Tax=Salipaludibacillus sp. HK11 TaxID=3394320 RepID=UPI0039FBC325